MSATAGAAFVAAQFAPGLDVAVDAVALGIAGAAAVGAIGSQWKSRVQALKDAVKKALRRGDEKMNIRLEPCED